MNVNEFKLTLVFSTAADLAAFSAQLAGGAVATPVSSTPAAPKKSTGGKKAAVTEATVMPGLGDRVLQQNAPSPFGDTHQHASVAPQGASQPQQAFNPNGQQAVQAVDRNAILANVSQVLDQLEKMGVPENNVGQLMTQAFARIGKPLGRVGMLDDQSLAAFIPGFNEYASAYLQPQTPPASRGFM